MRIWKKKPKKFEDWLKLNNLDKHYSQNPEQQQQQQTLSKTTQKLTCKIDVIHIEYPIINQDKQKNYISLKTII